MVHQARVLTHACRQDTSPSWAPLSVGHVVHGQPHAGRAPSWGRASSAPSEGRLEPIQVAHVYQKKYAGLVPQKPKVRCVLLHGIMKKAQKAPKRELDVARARQKAVEES